MTSLASGVLTPNKPAASMAKPMPRLGAVAVRGGVASLMPLATVAVCASSCDSSARGGASMLAYILIAVFVALLVFVVVAATRKSAYHVERKLEVAASADVVFGVLNDLQQFAGVFVLFGSPLVKRDPNMKRSVEGPATGVGQSYAW